MASEPLVSSTNVGEEIFNILKRRGPLCASQVAVEVGRSLKNVTTALEELRNEGLVEPRPDRDGSVPYDKYETPWGLSRPAWLRKAV
jgi:Mn-dependent DtxR family transcriptional regulator